MRRSRRQHRGPVRTAVRRVDPDALTGKIALGNIFDNSSASGSVSICTLAGGSTDNLTNSVMYEVAGVAMDNSGNCWASAEDVSAGAHLGTRRMHRRRRRRQPDK